MNENYTIHKTKIRSGELTMEVDTVKHSEYVEKEYLGGF